jgi:hypothetical protein
MRAAFSQSRTRRAPSSTPTRCPSCGHWDRCLADQSPRPWRVVIRARSSIRRRRHHARPRACVHRRLRSHTGQVNPISAIDPAHGPSHSEIGPRPPTAAIAMTLVVGGMDSAADVASGVLTVAPRVSCRARIPRRYIQRRPCSYPAISAGRLDSREQHDMWPRRRHEPCRKCCSASGSLRSGTTDHVWHRQLCDAPRRRQRR